MRADGAISGSGTRTTRQQRWLLLSVTLSVSIAFIDFTAVSIALPSIQRDLGISSTAAQWTIIAFSLAGTAAVAAGGRLADIFGRRRIYIGGLVVFAVASALCGLALNQWLLIFARAGQGTAVALFAPAGVALITSSFPPDRRGRALGTVGAATTIALASGPVLGGLITQSLGWRWIFYVNVPLAILVVTLARRTAPESRDEQVRRLDVPGLLLLTGGLVALVLFLTKTPDWGLVAPTTLALLLVAGLLLVSFGIVERRVFDPLVHPEVLRDRRILAASTVGFCSNFVIVAFDVYAIIYFQAAFGFSPLEAGLALLPGIIPQAFIARPAGYLADTIGPTVPIVAGMAAVAGSLVWISIAAEGRSYLAFAPGLVVFGIGIALVDTPTRLVTQLAVGEHRQGLGAGISSTLKRLGSTLGVALVGALIVALQYDRGVDLLARSGIRVDRDDRAALESLVVNGKTGIRELREIHHVAQVEHAAHSAFDYAFANGMRVGAVVAGLAGIVGVLLLRTAPRPRLATAAAGVNEPAAPDRR